MNFLKTTVILGLFVGTATIACGNALATPLGASANRDVTVQFAADSSPDLLPVQYRRTGSSRYSGYRGGRGSDGAGAAVAAGILGIIIGGMIAQEAQRQQYQDQNSAVAYCMQRFRSFDPQTMTFMGYDGLRHPCP